MQILNLLLAIKLLAHKLEANPSLMDCANWTQTYSKKDRFSQCLYTVYKIPQYLPVSENEYINIYRNNPKTNIFDLRKRYDECFMHLKMTVLELFIYVILTVVLILNLFYPMF
jgi:hypothetical protein